MTRILMVAILAFGLLSVSLPSMAATVSILRTEVGVGANYIIGYGSVVRTSEASVIADGIDPAIVALQGAVGPTPVSSLPGTAGITMSAQGSVAFDTNPGSAPSFFGTLSARIDFFRMSGFGIATGYVNADENYVFYEFEVSDAPVSFSLSLQNEGAGTLSVRNAITGERVFSTGPGEFTGTFNPGRYTLFTFTSLIATHVNGGASAQSMFAMTFAEGTELIVPPAAVIPLPAGAVLLGSALLGFAAWRRSARRMRCAR